MGKPKKIGYRTIRVVTNMKRIVYEDFSSGTLFYISKGKRVYLKEVKRGGRFAYLEKR